MLGNWALSLGMQMGLEKTIQENGAIQCWQNVCKNLRVCHTLWGERCKSLPF